MLKTILLLSVVMTLSKCDSTYQSLNLKIENNGDEFQVARHAEIFLTLPANPTTGYIWNVTDLDTTILDQIGKEEFKAEAQRIGAPGVQTFHFWTIAGGETTLHLIYHRPWEKDKLPLNTFKVMIRVAG